MKNLLRKTHFSTAISLILLVMLCAAAAFRSDAAQEPVAEPLLIEHFRIQSVDRDALGGIDDVEFLTCETGGSARSR